MTPLTIENVTLTFGGLNALTNVSMTIEPGLITSIIGPNGAGKTSMLNCISGFYHPTSGEIKYGDRRLTHSSPHQVTKLGIARAFQNLELFSGLSVLDNLMLARHTNLKYNFLQAMIYFGRTSRIEAENRAYVEDVIDFMEPGALPQKNRGQLGLRHSKAGGSGQGPDPGSPSAAAGRTHGRHEHRRKGRYCPVRHGHQERAQYHDHPGRTRFRGRHGYFRPHPRAGLRRSDRIGNRPGKSLPMHKLSRPTSERIN